MVATKSTVMQFRMDTKLKQEAEMLFRELGTSFAEALRIFAKQCVLTRSMPISISLTQQQTASGAFVKYADPEKRKLESDAFALSMKAKHENAR
jgi:addiction module RelB/DinJ family antitoxin